MTLAELIESRRRELGEREGKRLSYAELSARATAAGYSVSTPTLHNLATVPFENLPRRATMQAVAVALDVDEASVWVAALQSIGVELTSGDAGSDTLRAWLALTADRTPDEVAHLLRVARTVAEGYSGPGESRAQRTQEDDSPE